MEDISGIWFIIFNYLSFHGEMTGYEFMKYCKEKDIVISSSGIYPHLKKMFKSKLIDYREDGNKKIYFLTPRGRMIYSRSETLGAPSEIKEERIKLRLAMKQIDWRNKEDHMKLRNTLIQFIESVEK